MATEEYAKAPGFLDRLFGNLFGFVVLLALWVFSPYINLVVVAVDPDENMRTMNPLTADQHARAALTALVLACDIALLVMALAHQGQAVMWLLAGHALLAGLLTWSGFVAMQQWK